MIFTISNFFITLDEINCGGPTYECVYQLAGCTQLKTNSTIDYGYTITQTHALMESKRQKSNVGKDGMLIAFCTAFLFSLDVA